MRTRQRALLSALCVAGALLAPAVRADIPPIDSCTDEGATCKNAGPLGNRSGICTSAICSRGSVDGGVMHYDCFLCKEQGADGTSGAAGASGSSNAPASGDSGSGCSCSLKALGTERGIAVLMAALGLAALAVARRRG